MQKLLKLEEVEVKAGEEPERGDNSRMKWGGTKTSR